MLLLLLLTQAASQQAYVARYSEAGCQNLYFVEHQFEGICINDAFLCNTENTMLRRNNCVVPNQCSSCSASVIAPLENCQNGEKRSCIQMFEPEQNYMTRTFYKGSSCSSPVVLIETVTENICEPYLGVYIKTICDGSQSIVETCSDSQCTVDCQELSFTLDVGLCSSVSGTPWMATAECFVAPTTQPPTTEPPTTQPPTTEPPTTQPPTTEPPTTQPPTTEPSPTEESTTEVPTTEMPTGTGDPSNLQSGFPAWATALIVLGVVALIAAAGGLITWGGYKYNKMKQTNII